MLGSYSRDPGRGQSKELVTERRGRNDRKWPGNTSPNAHPYLKTLLCPSAPLPSIILCESSSASWGDRGGRNYKGHDPTLPPARRAPARQGAPPRGGGGQGASRPAGVHLRFTRHSRASRISASPSQSCGASWSSQLSFACLQKTTSRERTSGLVLGRPSSSGSQGQSHHQTSESHPESSLGL